jgi:hypothetical protein
MCMAFARYLLQLIRVCHDPTLSFFFFLFFSFCVFNLAVYPHCRVNGINCVGLFLQSATRQGQAFRKGILLQVCLRAQRCLQGHTVSAENMYNKTTKKTVMENCPADSVFVVKPSCCFPLWLEKTPISHIFFLPLLETVKWKVVIYYQCSTSTWVEYISHFCFLL